MQYLSFFVELFIWGLLYGLILNVAFNIIQLPFALIHRYAVYAVLCVQTYLFALYFANVSTIAVTDGQLATVPVLLLASLAMLFLQFAVYNNKLQTQHGDFLTISAIASIPAMLIIYFTKIDFLSIVINWYNQLAAWLLTVPVLGKILDFLVGVAGMWLALILIIGIFVFLIKNFMSILSFRR